MAPVRRHLDRLTTMWPGDAVTYVNSLNLLKTSLSRDYFLLKLPAIFII